MKITRGIPPVPPATCPVLTIGNFDGQHLGHRALIEAVVSRAHHLHGYPMVLTFDPHPVEVLRPGAVHKFLSEDSEKIAFFEQYGIAEMVILPFTRALADLTPEQFVHRVLRDGLQIRELLVGDNFVFGRGRSGTVKDLTDLGQQAHFTVEPIAPVMISQEVVSSTRIRKSLGEGDVVQGAQCLGRPYRLGGVVVPGEKRGSELGWPTANLRLPGHRVLPADGVYATITLYKGELLNSIAYIGTRPTFYEGERLLEVHIFDRDLQLYNESISVYFIERIRGDQTFSNVQDLLSQMNQDGTCAIDILQKYEGKAELAAVERSGAS